MKILNQTQLSVIPLQTPFGFGFAKKRYKQCKDSLWFLPPSLTTEERTIKTFFPCEAPSELYAKEIHMIVSDDDPWVKMEEAQNIASHYNATFTSIQNAGHINADSGYGKWDLIEKLVMQKTKDETE